MLRWGLLIVGIILTATGLTFMAKDGPHCGQPFLIWGVVVVFAVMCERWRYRRIEDSRNGRWQPTGERFEDPETGRTVEVQYDPASGERRYVQGDDRHSQPKQ